MEVSIAGLPAAFLAKQRAYWQLPRSVGRSKASREDQEPPSDVATLTCAPPALAEESFRPAARRDPNKDLD
jgi:hypothetical protein